MAWSRILFNEQHAGKELPAKPCKLSAVLLISLLGFDADWEGCRVQNAFCAERTC